MNTDTSKLSNADLIQYHANAAVTCWKALGHHKGSMNEKLAADYLAELTKRGLSTNTAQGVFNGPGSY